MLVYESDTYVFALQIFKKNAEYLRERYSLTHIPKGKNSPPDIGMSPDGKIFTIGNFVVETTNGVFVVPERIFNIFFSESDCCKKDFDSALEIAMAEKENSLAGNTAFDFAKQTSKRMRESGLFLPYRFIFAIVMRVFNIKGI